LSGDELERRHPAGTDANAAEDGTPASSRHRREAAGRDQDLKSVKYFRALPSWRQDGGGPRRGKI
jgi:hypothetical protein